MKRLKDFNLERIYLNETIKQHASAIHTLFDRLFETYMDDLRIGRQESKIFTSFMADMDPNYLQSHCPAEIVRDFIAGMTDRYFLRQCPAELRPAIVDV